MLQCIVGMQLLQKLIAVGDIDAFRRDRDAGAVRQREGEILGRPLEVQ
jgi:hypothetical protein